MKKYTYRMQFQKIKDDSTFWGDWSEELYINKSEIEEEMKLELEYQNNNINHRHTIIIDYEMKEVEIKNLTIEGIVSDYGEYEDYTVVVGKTNIRNLIINKFKGQKIKINFEVIE